MIRTQTVTVNITIGPPKGLAQWPAYTMCLSSAGPTGTTSSAVQAYYLPSQGKQDQMQFLDSYVSLTMSARKGDLSIFIPAE